MSDLNLTLFNNDASTTVFTAIQSQCGGEMKINYD